MDNRLRIFSLLYCISVVPCKINKQKNIKNNIFVFHDLNCQIFSFIIQHNVRVWSTDFLHGIKLALCCTYQHNYSLAIDWETLMFQKSTNRKSLWSIESKYKYLNREMSPIIQNINTLANIVIVRKNISK